MKKVSLLVLICMLASIVLMAFASCGEEEHTHAYGKEWVMDGTNHYNVCSCGAKSNSAAHADANNDGACDTCAVIMAHDHVFSPVWTSDATNHWNAVLCGHDVEVLNKAAHTPSELGICTVCGYGAIDVSTIAKSLGIAAFFAGEVVSGTFEDENNNVRFEYAEGYFHAYDVMNDKQVYVTKNADDTVCYVAFDPNEFLAPVVVDKAADLKYLGGYELNLNNYVSKEISTYGVLNLLNVLYNDLPETAPEGTTIEVVESVADGVYSFSYTLPAEAAYMEDTAISVTYTLDEKYFVNEMTATFTQGEAPAMVITFTQSDEAFVEDATPEAITPTEIVVNDKYEMPITFTEGVAETIEVFVGEYSGLYLDATAPENALMEAIDVTVAVKDADGEAVAGSLAYASYIKATHMVKLETHAPGTYYVHITAGANTYVVPFEATYDTPTEIYGTMFDSQNSDYVGIYDTIYTYTDTAICFGADLPEGCKPNAYTITVAETGATVTSLGLIDDGRGGEVLSYEFKATTAGTYTITFTATEGDSVTATAIVEVEQAPELYEIASGSWMEGNPRFGAYSTVDFYPTDNTKGVAVVSITARGTETVIFTYYIHEGKFVATPVVAGNMIQTLTITAAYQVAINEADYFGAKILEKVSDEPTEWTGEPLPEAPGYVEGSDTPVLAARNALDAAGTFVYTAVATAEGETTFYFELSMSAPAGSVTVTIEGSSDVTVSAENRNNQAISATDISVDPDENYGFTVVLNNVGIVDQTVTVTVVYTAAE